MFGCVVCPFGWYQDVVVVARCDHIAGDVGVGQHLSYRCGKSDGFEGAVDVEGEPGAREVVVPALCGGPVSGADRSCLLYTSDAADE